MRKVYIEAKYKIVVEVEEGIEISEVMSNFCSDFFSDTDGSDVTDVELLDYEIVDSK